ncbi:protein kinase C-binding protein 1 isoform X2 [Teleopsis dalmanni]|uniref:protein kinase C-binding protein 1 isoform X2 n=1 Tax=Teleopsis dalmanni TaxID=139649 RepID=UPI0018CD9126|nr:protein kinase C-binding protein 1 isoform X2 [Teleopsis dalmanni]
METETPDESLDSIPPPAYEAIMGGSSSSTPTVESSTPVSLLKVPKAENEERDENEDTKTEIKLLCNIVENNTDLVNSNKENRANILENDSMNVLDDNSTETNANGMSTTSEKNSLNDKMQSASEGKTSTSSRRCCTPLSREASALKKSVNESKILTEYGIETDQIESKMRILRKAGLSSKESVDKDMGFRNTELNSSKVKKSSKFAPLKDETSSSDKKYKQRGRSRSKSMNRNSDDSLNIKIKFQQKQREFLSRVRGLHNDEQYATDVDIEADKFDPQKDETSCSDHSFKHRGRSRSKSMSRADELVNTKISKWPSDDKIAKRGNMRSKNSDFQQKQREFLNRVKGTHNDEQYVTDDGESGDDNASSILESTINISNNDSFPIQSKELTDLDAVAIRDGDIRARLNAMWSPPPKVGWDSFCWKCRKCENLKPCFKCIRSFHTTCVKLTSATKVDNTWVCPECTQIENVLTGPKKSRRNDLSLDLLSQLLSFALKTMQSAPVTHQLSFDVTAYPKFIVNPVTFKFLEDKIEKKAYRCSDEFVADAKWMLHNINILTNGVNTKDTLIVKQILKSCKQESNEIESCSECYLNAHTRSDWFEDVCSQPHILLWAKLKGFPYWPAKAMGLGQNTLVNVRFFGKHDRAFVPLKECYLYSELDPKMQTGKRTARELADCIKEVELYIQNIKQKIGGFNYAPFKTPYDPSIELEQLETMMPGVSEFIKKQKNCNAKPSLQYKIVKTADNHLSIIKKNIANESAIESDHSNSSNKAKMLAPNYEVVSKYTQEDLNSSKLNTVILKRKSAYDDNKKNDESAQSSPKLLKVVEASSSVGTGKRKFAIDDSSNDNESEKTKAKQSKHEPKIPPITIKTVGPITIENKEDRNINIEKVQQQNVIEKLENKQGVTIKKITINDVSTSFSLHANTVSDINDNVTADNNQSPKDINLNTNLIVTNSSIPNSEETIKSSEQLAETQDNSSVTMSPDTTLTSSNTSNKAATDDNYKTKQEQNADKLIRGLVPFVEIKKEVLSDEEGHGNEKDHNNKKKSSITVKSLENINESRNTRAEHIPSLSVNNQSTNNDESTDTNLLTVKTEVMSDDENSNEIVNATEVVHNISNIGLTGNQTCKSPTLTQAESSNVRMVGDTTIQKLSTKNSNSIVQNSPKTQHTTSSNNTSITNIANANIANMNKRVTTRGVPFGPLPAMASAQNGIINNNLNTNGTPIMSITNNNSQQLQQVQRSQPQHSTQQITQVQQPLVHSRPSQRARKNFTNVSPLSQSSSDDVPSCSALTQVSASMVSIPVDVATSNRITNNTIQVPPLTSMLTSGAHNSNTPAQLSTIITPLIMSEPPPLAGLSQSMLLPIVSIPASSLSTTSMPFTTITTTALPTSLTSVANSSGSSQLSNGDNHILGDIISPSMAAAITETICRGPPKLMQRPDGPLRSSGDALYPSQAGPVSAKMVQNAHKLTDYFITVMADTINDMTAVDEACVQAENTRLRLEIEQLKYAHQQQLTDIKTTTDLMLHEMRKSMENETARAVNDVRKQCELERKQEVDATKRTVWCSICLREANLYCCWNTAYCEQRCQEIHWAEHAPNCEQLKKANEKNMNINNNNNNSNNSNNNNRLTPKTDVVAVNNINDRKNRKVGNSLVSTGCVKNVNNHKQNKIGPKLQNLPTSITADLLKLPSNTLVRAVPMNNSQRASNMQNSTQRLNGPISGVSSVNQPYTILHRTNTWDMRASNSHPIMPTNTLAQSSLNNSMTNLQYQQSARISSSTMNSNKGSPRNRNIPNVQLPISINQPSQI